MQKDVSTRAMPSLPTPPSAWIRRWSTLIPPEGSVLDVACGAGRHANWLLARGYTVSAVDRDATALMALTPGIEAICADLEDGSPWPLGGRQFAGVIVANYLHRPLFPHLREAIAPGGVLIYETFGLGNERFGRPSNPDFLLRPGELLEFCRDHSLITLAYECVETMQPRPAAVQRIAARTWP